MARSMIEKFDQYWSVIHGIVVVATVLDPRFKMRLIEYFFPLMYGQYASNEIDKIRKYCYDLVKECESNHIFNMGHQPSFTSSQLNQSDFEEMNPLMDNFDLFVSSTVSTDNVKLELDHYLDEAVLPRTYDFDILGWWKSNGTKYPILSALARDTLAIPVSTVTSESAFSTSGRFLLVLMHTSVATFILKIWIWMRNHAPLMGVKEEHHEI
ncbi:zinc finger BED domain-containing protein RICESLEEPER 1-like [Malus domestica]|uniref:zinc finger BED domain-containing protein RICESLEEPER 1-like n=1 Tax=Malus domestica TaxID=3750 RepID=UPI003976FDC8